MQCAEVTNKFAVPVQIQSGSESEARASFLPTRYHWRVQDVVGLELTMVPEVESVFVEKEDDSSFTVYTIVNERDLEVRSRIYDRELAILSALPGIALEFNILSRRNRPLESVIQSKEKPYKPVVIAA